MRYCPHSFSLIDQFTFALIYVAITDKKQDPNVTTYFCYAFYINPNLCKKKITILGFYSNFTMKYDPLP